MIVGSKARWMAAGSPPESIARRASSRTGSGGHQMSSSSSLWFVAPILVKPNSFLLVKHFLDLSFGLVGLKGTRNLRQELRSWAMRGLILEDWGLGPRIESKSEGVALGVEGEDGLWKNGNDEAVKERERRKVSLSEREGLLISLSNLFLVWTLVVGLYIYICWWQNWRVALSLSHLFSF